MKVFSDSNVMAPLAGVTVLYESSEPFERLAFSYSACLVPE